MSPMIAFPKLLLLWTGFFALIMWLPALFSPKTFLAVLERTLKNVDLVRVWAFISLLIWLLFLSVYWKLNQGWMMVFSIFGRLSLLKGLVLLRFPNVAYAKYKRFYSTTPGAMVMWVLMVIFAAFLIRLWLFLG